MAKGKHAAALFEVIHRDRRFAKSGNDPAAKLRAPWWLFRSRATADTATTPAPAPAPLRETESAAVPDTSAAAPAPRASRAAHVRVAVDPRRRHVAFRLSYASAIAGGFSLCLLLGMAYILGQRGGHAPTPLLARSIDQVQADPPRPDVLDVGRANAAARSPAATATTTRQNPAARGGSNGFNEPRPPIAHTEVDANRAIGLNYVIIQSYPDEKDANDARDLLLKEGVLCTVEPNIPGWRNWYCVVGVTGFEFTKNVPEYDAHIRRIMAVSNKFAGSSKFKKFAPQPYKWRG